MKVIIWVSSFFVITVLNVILGYATGFRAGFLVVYLLWFFFAKTLCRKWDTHKLVKAAAKNGVTPYEYIEEGIPESVKVYCENVKGNEEELRKYLKKCVKQKTILDEFYDIILKEYMSEGNPLPTTCTEIPKEENCDNMQFVQIEKESNMDEIPVTEDLEMQLKALEVRKKELEAKRKEEKRKKRSTKRGGLIALCIILAILSVSLSVAMVFSIKDITKLQKETKEEISLMQAKLNACESSLKNYKTWYNDSKDELADAKAQISDLQKENKALKDKIANSDPANVKYSYSFNSVFELMTAIKKNPSAYNNKQVKVVGTIYKQKVSGVESKILLDKNSFPSLSSSDIQHYIWKAESNEANTLIDIVIADTVMDTVLGTGDYIKLYGTVRISNGEIYLDKCSYDLILSNK